jgi:hypothetical protein
MHHRRCDRALVAVEQILLARLVELALRLVGLVQPRRLDRLGGVGPSRHIHLVLPQLFLELVLAQLVAYLVLAHDLLETGTRRRLHHDHRTRRRRPRGLGLPRHGCCRQRQQEDRGPQAKRCTGFEQHGGDAMIRG